MVGRNDIGTSIKNSVLWIGVSVEGLSIEGNKDSFIEKLKSSLKIEDMTPASCFKINTIMKYILPSVFSILLISFPLRWSK